MLSPLSFSTTVATHLVLLSSFGDCNPALFWLSRKNIPTGVAEHAHSAPVKHIKKDSDIKGRILD
jgi:hypothetical protein